MVILSSLFSAKVVSYHHMFRKGKPSSRDCVFYLEFAFILWWLSAYPWHPLHLDVICGHVSTAVALLVPGDKRSLNTEKSAFSTGVMFL